MADTSKSAVERPDEVEEALVRKAREELQQDRKKARADRMAAQHAADEKARQAADYARLLRKEAAEQAEAELYKAKADTLHRLLTQVAESRALDADSKEVNGSVPGLYTANITADMPQLDQTACACGSKKVFCQALSCLNLFCKPCARKAFRRHVPAPFDFQSCSMAEVPSHKCHALAKGHFCNICVDKHLVTCAECEQLNCSLTQCQNCFLDFCSGCMGDDEITCNTCQKEWAETYADLESRSSGFESDAEDEYDEDEYDEDE